jgi:hypothetical protein
MCTKKHRRAGMAVGCYQVELEAVGYSFCTRTRALCCFSGPSPRDGKAATLPQVLPKGPSDRGIDLTCGTASLLHGLGRFAYAARLWRQAGGRRRRRRAATMLAVSSYLLRMSLARPLFGAAWDELLDWLRLCWPVFAHCNLWPTAIGPYEWDGWMDGWTDE